MYAIIIHVLFDHYLQKGEVATQHYNNTHMYMLNNHTHTCTHAHSTNVTKTVMKLVERDLVHKGIL